MTSVERIDPSRMLSDQLAEASPDLLRELMGSFIQALMSAEADTVCGAGYGERREERVNSRNGYRHRDFDTRVGTIDLAIPKLRQGSYFPDWLLERRKRAERALTSVVATCYLLGVSTRRMEKLVESLGITGDLANGHRSTPVTISTPTGNALMDFRSTPLPLARAVRYSSDTGTAPFAASIGLFTAGTTAVDIPAHEMLFTPNRNP